MAITILFIIVTALSAGLLITHYIFKCFHKLEKQSIVKVQIKLDTSKIQSIADRSDNIKMDNQQSKISLPEFIIYGISTIIVCVLLILIVFLIKYLINLL